MNPEITPNLADVPVSTDHDSDLESQMRLSQIVTRWDEIFAAHARDDSGPEHQIRIAQEKVLRRYSNCIYDYLAGATRNPAVAEELSQEFAYRFVRGDLSRADPCKGRFRDYLKTALRNLVNDFYRSGIREKNGQPLPVNLQAGNQDEADRIFVVGWRQTIIQHAWQCLKTLDQKKNNHYYTVLRMRAVAPEKNSEQLAIEFGQHFDVEVNSQWIRQKLHRAREKFSEFLTMEVQKTVRNREQLFDELAELGLLKYLPKTCTS